MIKEYRTRRTCSRSITVEVDEQGIIQNVVFHGGCSGNTQGISALVKGMKAEEVIKRCKGIDCSGRGTSCPDQLALALEEMIGAEN